MTEEFELPQHSTDEECYDEYEEVVDNGIIVRKDIVPLAPTETGGEPGYSNTAGLNFSSELQTNQVKVKTFFDDNGRRKTLMKATKSAWVRNLLYLNGQKFDFSGREYLTQIYDHPAKEVLLKTGRQVEKCCVKSTSFLLASGITKRTDELQIGDVVASFNERGFFVPDKIVAIEENGTHPLYRITTRKGRGVSVTAQHPFRKLLEWCDAKDLKVGDFIGLPHRAGVFGNTREADWALILGSAKKSIPQECFSYDEESTAALLRGLWATNGHCKNVSSSKIDLCYSTISKQLVEDIQRLLLKFGIFSNIRVSKPTLYKDSDKVTYILRVTGRASYERFHRKIGPIPGKPLALVDAPLESTLHSDIFWDEVVNIEILPPEMTYAVGTEKYHNYVTDGIITHNSTMLSNNLTIMCALRPFFRCLYVSPSHVQTRTFSNDKLRPLLERSPLIRRYLQDSKVSQQVFEKGFTNGSFIFLRSAFLSADRSRGISSDALCLDELQDLILSNISVIAQCLSHSKFGYHIYAGTPKSFDNAIEIVWEGSSQNEWMVPCQKCSSALGRKWNFLDIKNVGKYGPICKYCGADLNPSIGQWQKSKESRMQGFRIPQLMVPWIATKGSEPWLKLVHDMETYPESQFYNEVLGLSYDNASKPVTRADVLQNCGARNLWIGDPLNMTPEEKEAVSKLRLFAGIDWGEGNDGTGTDIMGKIRTASYTLFTVGGYIGTRKFKVIYSKRYTGKEIDPDFIVKDVVRMCLRLNIRMIGVDWGHGWGVNNKLFRLYGPDKCVQFMYVDRQKEVRKWDPIGYKFQLLRNHVMSEIFYNFKEHMFEFPALEKWEHFAKDMFNISVEYIEYQRKIRYVHRPSDPDDWFHSLLYCKQVADIYHGKRK